MGAGRIITPWAKWPKREDAHSVHRVTRRRMNGAILLFLPVPSWYVQGQL